MNRFEAKYHAVMFVADLIDDFVKDSANKYPVLDTAAKKIMREVIVIQKRNRNRANRLSRDFEKFKADELLRKQ